VSPTVTDADFDMHGLRIHVSGDWPEIVEALRRDFAWFSGDDGRADVQVRVTRGKPDLRRFGPLRATRVTWRSAEYRDGTRAIVDYLGQAVAVDDGTGTFTLEGNDGWTVWRASYDYILDRFGEHANGLGLTLVNGLGLAGRQGGILVLLESGGGKTTLALRAISEGVGVLSEGSPLLDRSGCLHPFPVPLLVRTTSPEAASLPEEHVRRLPGIDPDPISLEVPAFADAVPREPVPLRHVILGARSLGPEATLDRLARRDAASALARATIGGFGILRGGGVGDAPIRLWQARGRVAAFMAALRSAQHWRLTLGLDKDSNWDALARLL
jgi:hypothetical protein